jgi:hypothetical protein
MGLLGGGRLSIEGTNESSSMLALNVGDLKIST